MVIVPTCSLIMAVEPNAGTDVCADMNSGQVTFLCKVQAVEEPFKCFRILERESVGSPQKVVSFFV